jgi:hypothetical protein
MESQVLRSKLMIFLWNFLVLLIFFFSKCPVVAAANNNENKNNFDFGKLELEGFTGKQSGGTGYGMLKLFSDKAEQQIIYSSVYGNYQASTANGIVGVGFGYRNIVAEKNLVGVYTFLDRNNLQDSSYSTYSFWILNPGLEVMGCNWDFHLNGYIPLSKKQWLSGDGFADQFGDYQYERLQGHTMYNKRMRQYANLGTGFDMALGGVIPHIPRAKVYVGSYFFNQNEGEKITGGFGKLVFALNKHMAVTLTDSYDKVRRNTLTAGVSIAFGGGSSSSGAEVSFVARDIHERMLDTPKRNWTAQNYGLSVPLTKSAKYYALSDSGFDAELNNIYSFRPDSNGNAAVGATDADGTFEHPYSYSDFNQATINAIGSNANLFFGGAGVANMGNVQILSGQSLYGRSSDFIRPAAGDARPVLQGSLNLSGGNTVEALRLENEDGIYDKGINFMNSNGVVYIRNVDVGSKDDVFKSYNIGVYASDVNMLDMRDANIYAANSTRATTAYGLEIRNSKANLNNTVINSRAYLSGAETQDAVSYGIFADHASLSVKDSSISAQSLGVSGTAGSGSTYGVYANNDTQIDLLHSTVGAVAEGKGESAYSSAVANAYGVLADHNSTLNIKNGSAISATGKSSADDTGNSNSYGVYAANGAAIKLENSTVLSEARGNLVGIGNANSYGAYVDNAMLVTNGSSISGSAYANRQSAGYGIFAANAAVVFVHAGNNLAGSGILSGSLSGNSGSGYGIYADNAMVNLASSAIAGFGSNNAYGVYAKSNNSINLLDRNNLFRAHNGSGDGDSYGIYSAGSGNQFFNENYKYSNYDVVGGTDPQKWKI